MMESGHLTTVRTDAAGTVSAARRPPETNLRDLIRLSARMLRALAQGRGNAAAAFGAWLHDLTTRYGSSAVLVRFGPKRILVVASEELARDILEPPPAAHGFVAGALKAESMGHLAHRALTVAHGHDWAMLRRYNEQALTTQPHSRQQHLLDATSSAFAAPVYSADDVRRAMGDVMLRIVFGSNAPARLADDVQTLFGLVQSPVRRRLARGRGRKLRARFYADVRAAWRDQQHHGDPTLLGSAHQYAELLEEDDVLQQVPHWMFTFTGSGTDLLVRGLTMLAARPGARARACEEIAAAGSHANPSAIDRLPYVEACLREAGRLFPPVTKTFHRAPAGAVAGGYAIPPDIDVLHYLPLLYRHANRAPEAHAFRPERWLSDSAEARPYPDIFLSGARACPGQNLILFVCKTAAATLLARGLTVHSRILTQDPLPLVFPQKEARFGYDSNHH